MSDLKSATVSITVTVAGETKTFTATAETDGSPTDAARALTHSLRNDAANWTFDLEEANR